MVRDGVGPWHQLVDAGCWPAVDELGQRVGHPGERIDRIEFAGFHERRDRRPVLGAEVVPGEECILSAECNTADRSLDRIGVDLYAAVIEEAAETIEVVETIAERVGK